MSLTSASQTGITRRRLFGFVPLPLFASLASADVGRTDQATVETDPFAADATPSAALFTMSDQTWEILVWAEDEWDALPEDLRPKDAGEMTCGGACFPCRVDSPNWRPDLSPDPLHAANHELALAREVLERAGVWVEGLVDRLSKTPPFNSRTRDRTRDILMPQYRERVARAEARCKSLEARPAS